MTTSFTLPAGRSTQTFHGLTEVPGGGGQEGAWNPELERGVCLGRFVLLDLLARGGMGEVYLAYDPELDRKVALKMLRGGGAGQDASARLLREAQAAARLSHSNVVQVYEVGHVGDRVFLAMELVDGQSLENWLAQGRRPWREVLKVLIAAGRGLAAIHAAGLIHHDFKPSNVMLTAAGEPRVIDFGIADLGREEATEEQGPPLGTPAYLAPERLAAGPADGRSDQFSFCVALYEALCGEHPFLVPGDPAGSLERLRLGQMKDARRLRALPGWLTQALRRGLRPSPMERFPTMEALLAVLASGLRRRRRAWMGTAAGLLLASGGWAGALWDRSSTAELCSGAESRLTGVWDAARKERIRASFAATGLSLAGATSRRVESALDQYAADWQAMKRDACEATHLRGEQSAQILDLRELCLEGRRAELRVLSDLFAAADREVVIRAGESLSTLTELSTCGPDIELTTLTPLPADPVARQRIERLQVILEGQRVRFELAQEVDLEKAEHAIEAARSLAYPPLAARALALRARLRLEAGDPAAAETAAEEALLAAIAGGDRLLQASIYALLLETESFYREDREAARRWKRFVEASITAFGPQHPDQEFTSRLALFRYAWAVTDHQEAIRHARRALEIGERLWGSEDLRLADALTYLGLVMSEAGASQEGSAHLERALTIRTEQLGADNPRLAPTLANLATNLAYDGQYQKALELSLRSLDLVSAYDPEGGAEAAYPEMLTGQILTAMDRPMDAEAYLRRSLRSARETFGAEHSVVVAALVSLSHALLLQERLDEAGVLLDQAERIAASALPAIHPYRLELLDERGLWWLERQRPEPALESLEEASAQADALAFPPGGRLKILCGLGEAELGLGRSARARQRLQEALALIGPGTEPRTRARIRFALARTLPPEEQERAFALAETALQELSGTSPWSKHRRQRIEAWLAAREANR